MKTEESIKQAFKHCESTWTFGRLSAKLIIHGLLMDLCLLNQTGHWTSIPILRVPQLRPSPNIVKTFAKVVTYPKCPAGQGFSHCAPVQPPGHLQVPDTCQHSPPLRHVHVPMHRRPYVPSVITVNTVIVIF